MNVCVSIIFLPVLSVMVFRKNPLCAVRTGFCKPIERATGGAVTRRNLRPHGCDQIQPDLATNQQPIKELG